MLSLERLEEATDELLAAATVGRDWGAALQRLAVAAGARDVAIIRNRAQQLVAATSTPGFAAVLDAQLKGHAPSNSRPVRVRHDLAPGFRVDHDDYTPEQLASDPFYQEVLRPAGLFWHASARLGGAHDDELVICFKRELRSGPYQHEDARRLDRLLTRLKAAVSLGHRPLEAEARDVSWLLHRHGDPVFEFDARGRVRGTLGFTGCADYPVRLVRDRLVAVDDRQAGHLDQAIAAATAFPQRTALVALKHPQSRAYVLHIFPLRSAAPNVFVSTVAVGVLVGPTLQAGRQPLEQSVIFDLFDMTAREAQLAILISEGLALNEIAARMRITIGTARAHLKKVFEKSDTRRQAELVSLIARFLR